MSDPRVGRAEIYLTAARAYCLAKFSYGDGYVDGEAGRQRHIENDASEVAERPWVRAMVDAALDARAAGMVRHPDENCPVCGTDVIEGRVDPFGRQKLYACGNGHALTIKLGDPNRWEAEPGVSYSHSVRASDSMRSPFIH